MILKLNIQILDQATTVPDGPIVQRSGLQDACFGKGLVENNEWEMNSMKLCTTLWFIRDRLKETCGTFLWKIRDTYMKPLHDP